MSEQPDLWSYAKLQTTDIKIDSDIPFDLWEQLGEYLHGMIDAGRWCVGGWAAFGEARFGEEYAASIPAIRVRRVEQALWVWRKVPKEIRHENLSWSHHRACAGIDDVEIQRKLLDLAEANAWDVSTLMAAVKQAKKTAGADVQPPPLDTSDTTRLFGAAGRVRTPASVDQAAPSTDCRSSAESAPEPAGFTPRVVAGKDVDQVEADQYVFFWAVIEAARDAIAKGEITAGLRKAVADIDALEAISKRSVG